MLSAFKTSATQDKLQEMEKTMLSAFKTSVTQDKLQEMEKTMLSAFKTSATQDKLQEMEKIMLSAFKTLEEKIDDQRGSSDEHSLKMFNCGNNEIFQDFLMDASTGSWPQSKFCMAYDDQFDTGSNTSYEIS